nr:hypothetical protein GCM10025699_14360 [Microbacterium flavescens]
MTPESESGISRRNVVVGGGVALAGMAAAVALLDPTQARAAAPRQSGAAFRLAGPARSAQVVRAGQTLVYPDAWSVRPFPLSSVKLGQSVFTRALNQHLVLYRAYSVDKILAVFRRNAGLPTNGATPPGGWEEYGPNPEAQRWGPREYTRGQNTAGAGGRLRGHYGGHFLSGVSMAYAATGELALLNKVNAIVDGLEECRAALAAQEFQGAPRYSHPGFLSAYGEWQFSALEEFAPYGEIWAPYYTLHKILAGLLDAHALAGSAKALQLAEGIGHWVYSRLSKCTPAQLARMWGSYIAGEYGGMNEVLVELYWRSADPQKSEFLDAAQLFTLHTLVDACATGTDTLNGKHANQHIPQFPGYVKLAAETGDDHYLDATKGFFDMVVPGRVYAHGGTGEGSCGVRRTRSRVTSDRATPSPARPTTCSRSRATCSSTSRTRSTWTTTSGRCSITSWADAATRSRPTAPRTCTCSRCSRAPARSTATATSAPAAAGPASRATSSIRRGSTSDRPTSPSCT